MNEKELVKSIVERYQLEYRYMKSAKMVNHKRARGIFRVDKVPRLVSEDLEHLGIGDIVICLLQFIQIVACSLVESGHVEEWGPIKWKEYWGKTSREHMLIAETFFEFNEMIPPYTDFPGTIILRNEFKSRKGNYHLKFHFDFADGAHTGEVRLVFIP